MSRTNNLIYSDPLLAIAAGVVKGAYAIHKYGHNASVSGTLETIWSQSSVYVYPAAATILKISSGSISDVSSSTGAWTVTIFGLDADYAEQSETISLNGQTEVNSVGSYIRINRMIVRTAGTGGKNAGIVYAGVGTVTTGVPATVYAAVPVGLNQSLMAMYTVPAGYDGYVVDQHQTSSIAKAITAHLVVRPFGEVFQVKDSFNYTSGEVNKQFALPLKIEAKSDIEIQALAVGAGGDISASFSIYMLKRT